MSILFRARLCPLDVMILVRLTFQMKILGEQKKRIVFVANKSGPDDVGSPELVGRPMCGVVSPHCVEETYGAQGPALGQTTFFL